MIINEILEIYNFLDRPGKPGKDIIKLFRHLKVNIPLKMVKEKDGETEFVKIIIPGKNGKTLKGKAPTLGIIGRLGGIGARPESVGFVSDGDGALAALSIALKLARMQQNGDCLYGDVIISTHLCTNAPTIPHKPVPFMGSPVKLSTMNKYEVDKRMDAILSIDTSRGNRIINNNGFAISPTVKEGWILRVSEDLITTMEYVTGNPASVVPITMQDITPYGNGIHHFNSIMQPCIATQSPVVGIAITSVLPVPGCWTGTSNAQQIDLVGRYVVEVAQQYGKNKIKLFDENEYERIKKLYGNMDHILTLGNK